MPTSIHVQQYLPAFLLSALLAGPAGLAYAQGVQTGSIRGTVRDQMDLPIPGATVTASSPALQGVRTAVTDMQGTYTLLNLPAGDYELRFEASGFATVTQKTTVLLGLATQQNVTLRPAAVTETVRVVAETPAPIATPVVGANFKHDKIEQLANLRTIQGIAQLAPATTVNSPNANQLVINGAFAFDNVFMINGVDVNDNLFASPQNLFVEDAIQETQVLTSGISAEYGRFSGGVINAITKSGGNTFSGSFRTNFLNPKWTTATPFEVARGTADVAHPDILSRTYEATFGGPILRDRLWFFLAGRYASVDSTTGALPQTGLVLPTKDLNKRGEIKLTGTVTPSHTLQGGFFNNPRTVTNNSGIQSFVIDPHSEVDRDFPNWYVYTNYKGVLGSRTLVEAQYSERRFVFNQTGPSGSNLVTDSPFLANSCVCLYNAPYFDASDPENRNNRQVTGSVTRFWEKKGRHDTKVGYEFFRSQRTGGNSQSPTNYVFNADFVTDAAGKPVLDATGRPIPMFVPGETSLDYYPAVKGAVLNIDNHSAFVQDHWAINARWSADLGARFEHVKAVSTGDIVSVDANRIVPRLAVGYDVAGTGNHVVHLTYGQYSGRYNEAQIGANSPVGNPADFTVIYQGPPGQGYNFAPGFDLKNYPITGDNASVSVPTANVFVDPNLKSPLTHEVSASYGANFGNGRGYGEMSYVYRKTGSLIGSFTTIADGTTHVVSNGIDAGIVSNVVYRNTDIAHRSYSGLVFQTRYSVNDRWSINGHYTLQLTNDGNYEGESTNQPGNTGPIGKYPEAYPASRYYPDGRLQDFQRHRLRLWSIYHVDMHRFGDVSVSGLWRVDSARIYSLVQRNVAINATQRAILRAAGYPDIPGLNNVFYADRGTEEFAGYGLVDFDASYSIPVFRSARPWVKFDIYNLFNNQKLIAWSTTITGDPNSPKDAYGLPTGYIKSSTFGTATGNTVTNGNLTNINVYPVAFPGAAAGGRTYGVAVGIRF